MYSTTQTLEPSARSIVLPTPRPELFPRLQLRPSHGNACQQLRRPEFALPNGWATVDAVGHPLDILKQNLKALGRRLAMGRTRFGYLRCPAVLG